MLLKNPSSAAIDEAMQASLDAFDLYRKQPLSIRSSLLNAIAKALETAHEELTDIASKETHLEKARLKLELTRCAFQLNSYAAAIIDGSWMDVRIEKTPKNTDIRKMMVPLGPVVVFGASNFPFAYSTAGGDTASALAAGCSVIVKGHPAHKTTSSTVAQIIENAVKENDLPEALFIHIESDGVETGEALVKHPVSKAVGFTGSFEGGTALYKLATQRAEPIPVFAEMGSVNPVFIFEEKLKDDPGKWASLLAASITDSAGQFCTNPGVLIGLRSENLESFKKDLAKKISFVPPTSMLHPGIAKNFQQKRAAALDVKGVEVAGVFSCPVGADESIPTLAETDANTFLQNPALMHEVFGPYSILVKCSDVDEMMAVAKAINGQLTCTVIASEKEIKQYASLMDILQTKCGRFIMNGVPTGVEVTAAMHHGGPFPATTDSRLTAVGADAIKRFARPVCYQNWTNDVLPDELKNKNPLGIWRFLNNERTKAAFQ